MSASEIDQIAETAVSAELLATKLRDSKKVEFKRIALSGG
jgi:hypothetical protein